MQITAAEAKVAPAAVQQRVDDALARLEEAREQAIAAAERVRVAALILAFGVAVTMVGSAAIAYFAAAPGGQRRDQNMPLSRLAFRRDI